MVECLPSIGEAMTSTGVAGMIQVRILNSILIDDNNRPFRIISMTIKIIKIPGDD